MTYWVVNSRLPVMKENEIERDKLGSCSNAHSFESCFYYSLCTEPLKNKDRDRAKGARPATKI